MVLISIEEDEEKQGLEGGVPRPEWTLKTPDNSIKVL